jgi:hypothetical protein
MNEYLKQLRREDSRVVHKKVVSNKILEEQRILQYRKMREEEYSNSLSTDGGGSNVRVPEFVFVDPLPELPNDDAWIRMNGWCSNGNGVGGNSERVLRPNHPDFLGEVTVNGRLAYYTEIGGEKCIYNDTLNRWELSQMSAGWLLGIGEGSNIPYPFYATWTTYVDPFYNASIGSIEKVAVGTTKAPDPGPPCPL